MAQSYNRDDFTFSGPAGTEQSEAASDAKIKGIEANYANAVTKAELQKKQAEAEIIKATSVDALREARAKADRAEADAITAKAAAQAAIKALKGPTKTATEQTADTRILGDMNTAVDTINLLTKQFNKNLAGQGLIKSTLEYFPTQEKGAINSTAAGLADVGLALFKIPGMGSQSDADATRFVQANQPSTSDFDMTFLGKMYNLRRRIDAKVRSMGLPPIRWTEPVDVAARQYFSLPESERSKLGVRAVGTFKDVPDDYFIDQTAATQDGTAAATQADVATQADASTALPSNAAFAQPIGMEAAAFGGDKTSIPIPPEMQADMNEWFGRNPRGTVGLKSYSDFRRALDMKYGFGRDKPYEDDPGTVEFLKQYNDPNVPLNVAIPPVTANDERSTLERAAGTAVMNPVGTAVATGVSGLGLNALDAVVPQMAALREMNPNAAMVGDITGSIGGSSALAKLGTAGASKLLAQAPELAKYVTSGGKGATFLRNLLSDTTQGAAYGAAVEGDAGTGAISGAAGTVLGKALGDTGSFILRGADRAPTVQKLMDRYGVKNLTLGQQMGGVPKSIEDAATSMPIVGDVINARRGESLIDLNKAAFREVGGQPIGYGDEAAAALAAARVKAYDDAVAGKQFDLNDPLFTQDMVDALAARRGLTGEFADKFDLAVKNSIIDTPIGRSGTMSGPDYQQAQRKISGYKSETTKPGFEKDYRDALSGVSGALREMVERQDPTLVPRLSEADRMYRGEKILGDAIERAKMDPTGMGADVFTPGNLTQAVSASGRKYPGTPPLKELSRLAQNVIPSKMPDSGTARRAALTGLGLAGAGGVAGGGLGYNQETGLSAEDAAYGAATTLTPLALLSLLGSRGGQRGLSKFMFDRPAIGGNIADLAEKYGPQRVLAPGLIPMLVPDAREEPVLASEAEVAAAERAAVAPVAEAEVVEAAPIPEDGVVMFGDKAIEYDPETDTFVELATGRRVKDIADLAKPVKGMYRGGSVQAFNKGGNKGTPKKQSSYGTDLLRQIGEGVSFNNADELEAMARAGFLTPEYYALKEDLERRRGDWAKQNPKVALAAQIGGSMIPGVAGAFVPGGQVGTAATLARVGRALDAPVEALMKRAAPQTLGALQRSRLGRTATAIGDELANGVLYSVGAAPNFAAVPQQILDDLAKNAAMAFGVRTATAGGRRAVRSIAKKVRGR